MILAATTFIIKDNKILLGFKKRGFGMNKWNTFGGKLDKGESYEEAAKREVFEECELNILSLEEKATLNFSWVNNKDKFEVHVFQAISFTGQPVESEEMLPQWFDLDKIPYAKMWPDNKLWWPLFLAGQKINASFVYGPKDKLLTQQIELIK
ncbi:MAG: 8-oxo-dGTP diphosphatase / 2-hydroxy-dATP diphosphatase [Patescibacteria group bacterium]|nr:8-oxo-dGTP diphosphatase / 2-hydroxy-dATP diphosphatase [Patescibacteria group bacterium]MDQ5970680.1 8-oxo-dGTP diphosphatase / 2-hydroxy-dATP diphosphatase [Patescibacteria group bacterium]